MADDTDLGPLATEQVLADVTRQVADSVAAGARLLCGGKRIGTRGNFYAPTALADLPAAAPAYREEVFGPVAGVFAVQDAGAAIALANASPFGLGASVWTTDEAEQRRFIDELEVGMTFVNAMVASDPRLPFGGVKRSGHGRELSAVGIREFAHLKTVYIAAAR
jgi:succinate-semialdehyde dehydrogenase/glutarate-semialdehyde dehydrogenase